MCVPPPMPCAIKASLSTARVTSRSRSDGETCASRVWKTKASASRKLSTTPWRKRTKNVLFAIRRDADYIVTFDADGQHQATDIARLGPSRKDERQCPFLEALG
jgi:hypothetical protein